MPADDDAAKKNAAQVTARPVDPRKKRKMKRCPDCNSEMAEADFRCRKCGWIKKYINSDSKMCLFLNATVAYYKQAGFFHTVFYLFARLLHSILTFPYNFKQWLHIKKMIATRKQMEPPWIAFPDIPLGSIGWRMGGGESFLMIWDKWYIKLSNDIRLQYQVNHPEPAGWEGFYESRQF